MINERVKMMPKELNTRPRIVKLLNFFLFLQMPVMVLIGLNLLTDHWSFLGSWPVFWDELKTAYLLVIQTPGELINGETLFYEVVAFAVLVFSAATALIAGMIFPRGKPTAWILSLIAQIYALLCGIALYLISRPSQAYWLIAVGIIMVMYLNYAEVRQWFLHTDEQFSEDARG